MKSSQTKLYSLAVPFAFLLPVMDMHLSDIPAWFRGTEFLSIVSGILIELFTNIADVLIAVFVSSVFGTGAA
jgi:hypothetical protein